MTAPESPDNLPEGASHLWPVFTRRLERHIGWTFSINPLHANTRRRGYMPNPQYVPVTASGLILGLESGAGMFNDRASAEAFLHQAHKNPSEFGYTKDAFTRKD